MYILHLALKTHLFCDGDAIVCDVVTATPTYPALFDRQLAIELLCIGFTHVRILYWAKQIIS